MALNLEKKIDKRYRGSMNIDFTKIYVKYAA